MFEEELGARDITAEQAYIAGVRTSEIHIGLFGPRYWVRMGDGSSATRAELMEAEKRGLRLCVFEQRRHGIGLGREEATANRWPTLCAAWVRSHRVGRASGLTRRQSSLSPDR